MNSIRKIGIIFLSLFLFLDGRQFLVQILIQNTSIADYFLIELLSSLLVLGLLVVLCHRMHMTLWNRQSIRISSLIEATIIVFANIFFMGRLQEWLPQAPFANQEAIVQAIQQSQILTTVLMLVFIGPFLEELVFRGILMTYALPQHPFLSFLLSSTLFAYLHSGPHLAPFVIYFTLSAGLSLVYLRTKSLECTIYAHALHNGISVLAMYGLLGGL